MTAVIPPSPKLFCNVTFLFLYQEVGRVYFSPHLHLAGSATALTNTTQQARQCPSWAQTYSGLVALTSHLLEYLLLVCAISEAKVGL